MIRKSVMLFALVFLAFLKVIGNNEIPIYNNRSDIPAKYKWDLTPIYSSWEQWEHDLDNIKSIFDELAMMRGTLGLNSKNLAQFFKKNEEAGVIRNKLFGYAYLFRSIDSRVPEANSRYQQITGALSQLGTKVSWVAPEILAIPEETVHEWIERDTDLQPFSFRLKSLYRNQKYVHDAETEKLLSYYSNFSNSVENIYTELSTSDIKLKEVSFSDGSKLLMTPGNYSRVLTFNRNREDREKAYKGFFEPYKEYENTYASILNSVYQSDWASVRARGYDSFLQASLYGDSIPQEVYLNLINTAKSNTSAVQKYYDIRRRALGYEKYQSWDGLISLTNFDKRYTWEDATILVQNAVKPLGKDYQSEIAKCFEGGWIDVYETPGKEGGAYNMGVYAVHPYVLMNYNGTLSQVFTLAHELGHSLHSIYSCRSLPFNSHYYSTFVAEVASIFNEHLLLDYMLTNSKDPLERIALLDQAIGVILAKFYRQSLFADFEYQVRTAVEEGKPVNAPLLNAMMGNLLMTYYGDAIEHNELTSKSWAYVMHFFQLKYYVFQYATSYAASAHLFDKITQGTKSESKRATDLYTELLKSGGNDFPINQLRRAGVDMTDPNVITSVAKRLDQLVYLLEKELKAINAI